MDISDALSRFQAISADSTLPRVDAAGSREQLEEVAQEFESLFVKMMMDAMRDTRNQDDNFTYGGMAEDIFEDMLYTEYSRSIAKRGDFGIADMIINQFSPALENGVNVSASENS
jgi:flagellar protein FlgJ